MKAFHRRLVGRSAKAFALQCAVVMATVGIVAIRAQSPRPMSIVDLLSLPRLTEPQLSPDGRDIVFTRSDADWKTGRRISHVWRARAEGGEPVQLTHGTENETGPRWSPDGRTVAFIAKRGDNEFAQIYLLAVDGGEARQLTTHASAWSVRTSALRARTCATSVSAAGRLSPGSRSGRGSGATRWEIAHTT